MVRLADGNVQVFMKAGRGARGGVKWTMGRVITARCLEPKQLLVLSSADAWVGSVCGSSKVGRGEARCCESSLI